MVSQLLTPKNVMSQETYIIYWQYWVFQQQIMFLWGENVATQKSCGFRPKPFMVVFVQGTGMGANWKAPQSQETQCNVGKTIIVTIPSHHHK